MEIDLDQDTQHLLLRSCSPSTPAVLIPCWRSQLHNSIIIAIDGTPVDVLSNITSIIATATTDKQTSITFALVPQEYINTRPDNNVPQIHFDQMNIMAYQHNAAIHDTKSWHDPHNLPPVNNNLIFAVTIDLIIPPATSRLDGLGHIQV